MTTRHNEPNRRMSACLITTSVLVLLAQASCQAGPPTNDADTPPSLPAVASAAPPEVVEERALRSAELNQARIVIIELQQQIHVATAKLDEETLTRKREIGETRALLNATEAETALRTARIQRLEERRRQLLQDVLGADAAATAEGLEAGHPLHAPVERLGQQVEAGRAGLMRLTEHHSRLKQKLAGLHRQHIHKLLMAMVDGEDSETSLGGVLERVLDQLGGQ